MHGFDILSGADPERVVEGGTHISNCTHLGSPKTSISQYSRIGTWEDGGGGRGQLLKISSEYFTAVSAPRMISEDKRSSVKNVF